MIFEYVVTVHSLESVTTGLLEFQKSLKIDSKEELDLMNLCQVQKLLKLLITEIMTGVELISALTDAKKEVTH